MRLVQFKSQILILQTKCVNNANILAHYGTITLKHVGHALRLNHFGIIRQRSVKSVKIQNLFMMH